MRVELITPIAQLHGKLNGRMPYYFKTVNGKTFVQRCPVRRARPTTRQTAARERFSAIAKMVAQMRQTGTKKSSKQLWQIATEAYDAANR